MKQMKRFLWASVGHLLVPVRGHGPGRIDPVEPVQGIHHDDLGQGSVAQTGQDVEDGIGVQSDVLGPAARSALERVETLRSKV